MSFTHLNANGEAEMVDITAKAVTEREASAEAFVLMQPATLQAIADQQVAKGDVLATARIAGIQAAKQCSQLIPLCHPLMLTKVAVCFELQPAHSRVRIVATCKLAGKTGVEMEALTAASVAALTIFDMCKALEKTMEITGLRVLHKSGGKSGDFRAQELTGRG